MYGKVKCQHVLLNIKYSKKVTPDCCQQKLQIVKEDSKDQWNYQHYYPVNDELGGQCH